MKIYIVKVMGENSSAHLNLSKATNTACKIIESKSHTFFKPVLEALVEFVREGKLSLLDKSNRIWSIEIETLDVD